MDFAADDQPGDYKFGEAVTLDGLYGLTATPLGRFIENR
jgi:hypothetical protein